jgi:ABC-2 type transport system permease protein
VIGGLRARVWYNPDLQSRWFYLPVILALVLMLNTLILPSMGIVREKEIGTLEQILVTPLRPWQLIVGKLLPFAVIGFVNTIAVTAVIVFGFGVPLQGSFLLLLLLTAPFLLTNLSLGLWVSTLVRTQQQAMMTAIFLLMIPMIYLSGLIFPIENMPQSIQWFTYAIPLRYYAVILRGIFLKGSDLGVLWPQAVVLLGFGVIVLMAASMRFRKSLD